MIYYETGKDKRITISILSGNKCKLKKTNLSIIEVIDLLTINLAMVVANNLYREETEDIIDKVKHNLTWFYDNKITKN
jgi:hypothetical protein